MPTLGDRVAERYELLSELGHGGGATVYLAHDSRVGGEVALKIVAAAGHSFQLLQARIEREARLSYRLGQMPGIVRALDYGVLEPGQSLYLALDLVRGAQPLDLRSGTLAERLERVAQAAEIVKRLHECKVIHRDLKPDNFLVSEEGELFLADFGIAKGVDDATPASEGMRTATGALLGTPMFMAMEQFESAASARYAADVYSLGVMLFYALTGRFPFEGTNAVEVMSAQLEVRYRQRVPPRPSQLDPSVDPDLDRLCAFAIDIDPRKRPAQIPLFVRSLRLAVDRLRGSSERRAAVPQRDPMTLSASGKRSALVIPRDEEGFASLRELRSLQEQLGPERFEALLDGAPALIVEHERPLEGVANYQDQVAVLPSGALGAPMFIGRSKSRCDVVFALPTISNPQVRIERVENGWEIRDLGSRNGTELNGSPLRPNEGRPLSSGDQFCLSRHVRLKFLFASGLSEHLLWTG